MMNKQKDYFGLTLVISVLLILILILFACAPTKVQVYPRETPPEKTIPPKTTSERTAQEKTAPVKTTPEKTTSVKTDKVKFPSERPPTEKIPTVKPAPEKTYDETVSEWKSYQDLVKWMENDFSFDKERYEKFEGTLPIPRNPEMTFQLKLGIYIDAAMFLKETLNRINPSYKAQIVILIIRPYGFNHYVCSFRKDGKLFIMDYGTPYKEVTGVHGPYNSLDEYKRFYEKHHPEKRYVEGIGYLQ
jgi:Na+-transporting methylmalonyl-CoA/oxaloacetate decarboxylase gamma subunit